MKDYIWLACFIAFGLGVLVWGLGRMAGINHVRNQLIAADLAYYSVDAKSGATRFIIRGIP